MKDTCKIMQDTCKAHNTRTYSPSPRNPELVGIPISLKKFQKQKDVLFHISGSPHKELITPRDSAN